MGRLDHAEGKPRVTITAAQIQPIIAMWQAALNALNALVLVANTSPPGTQINGPNSTGTITDGQGNVWQMGGTSPAGQYYNMVTYYNTQQQVTSGQSEYLVIDTSGVVWGYFPGQYPWWKYNGAQGWTNYGASQGPVT
jgi:hypothetical protein